MFDLNIFILFILFKLSFGPVFALDIMSLMIDDKLHVLIIDGFNWLQHQNADIPHNHAAVYAV